MTADFGWLTDLYEGLEGYIELRAFKGIRDCEHDGSRTCADCAFIRFSEDVEGALEACEEAETKGGFNVYLGMATRQQPKPGGKKDLKHCRVLWIDYDLEGEEGELDDLDVKLSEFQHPPSYVCDSGGGRHVFWVLEDPVDVSTEQGKQWIERTLAGLQDFFGSDRKVVDAARIMRVPGTTNHPDAKKLAKGRVIAPARVLGTTGAVYSADDFEEIHERGKALRAAREQPKDVDPSAPKQLPEKVRATLEGDDVARRLFLHQVQALPPNRPSKEDTSASVFDFHLIARLLNHPTLTKAEIVDAAKAARVRAGAKTDKLSRPDYWERTYKSALDKHRGPRQEQPVARDRASRFRQVMRDVAARVTRLVESGQASSTIREHVFSLEVDPTLRWPTGIPDIDGGDMGGLYGLATLAGQKNVGKSLMLNQCSLLAAANGWTVAQFDAENAGNVWNRRVQKWYGVGQDEIQKKLVNLRRFWVETGVAFDDIVEWACSAVQADTRKLLLCFDSFNTVLTKMTIGRRSNYFDEYDRLLLWCMDVRATSLGHIGVMLASEMNANDVALGRKIEFIEDCGLAITAKGEKVKLRVEKSRESKKPDGIELRIDERYHLIPWHDDDEGDQPHPFNRAEEDEEQLEWFER